ncbi:MAG: hypothetical protein ACPL8I_01740 [Chloroflexaceae bacterium]
METFDIVQRLEDQRLAIIEDTVNQAMREPFWVQRFGEGINVRLKLDLDRNFGVLIQSIRYRSPMIFEDHTRWRRDQIRGFGCSTGHIREMYGNLWRAITRHVPEQWHSFIFGYMQTALEKLAFADTTAYAVAEQQTLLAEDLARVTFDRHWHWQAAYRADGRDRLLHEYWYLIDYLVDALGVRSTTTLGQHVQWQRDAWIRRGLSTNHMQRTLWLLGEGLAARLAQGLAEETWNVLAETGGALAYQRQSCQALQSIQAELIEQTAERLIAAGVAPGGEETTMEVGWYVAYLLDSMAAGVADPLLNYTRWMQHWLAHQGLPDSPLRLSYEALGEAITRLTPDYAAQEALAVLQVAHRAISA